MIRASQVCGSSSAPLDRSLVISVVREAPRGVASRPSRVGWTLTDEGCTTMLRRASGGVSRVESSQSANVNPGVGEPSVTLQVHQFTRLRRLGKSTRDVPCPLVRWTRKGNPMSKSGCIVAAAVFSATAIALSFANAARYFVRPFATANPVGSGTTYGNAFNGLSNIAWDADGDAAGDLSGVRGGDTPYACGIHPGPVTTPAWRPDLTNRVCGVTESPLQRRMS